MGQRRGNASTSDFSAAAIEQTVRAAFDIARFTAEDPAAGLPEAEDLATADEAARDLDLALLDSLVEEVSLNDAIAKAGDLMDGKVRGRVVVRITG